MISVTGTWAVVPDDKSQTSWLEQESVGRNGSKGAEKESEASCQGSQLKSEIRAEGQGQVTWSEARLDPMHGQDWNKAGNKQAQALLQLLAFRVGLLISLSQSGSLANHASQLGPGCTS